MRTVPTEAMALPVVTPGRQVIGYQGERRRLLVVGDLEVNRRRVS